MVNIRPTVCLCDNTIFDPINSSGSCSSRSSGAGGGGGGNRVTTDNARRFDDARPETCQTIAGTCDDKFRKLFTRQRVIMNN